MRATAKILLIICLLFLVGTVGAADASVISKTSGDWVVANGMDHFDVIVTVSNTTGSVVGADVVFTVNDPELLTMSPDTVTTGSDGLAIKTFTVNTKSGTATITATISYTDVVDGESVDVKVEKSVLQNIDHDINWIFSPASVVPDDITVGTIATFTVLFTDEWGNPIDDKNLGPAHAVTLSVSCPNPNDCEFVGVGHYLPSAQLGKNGDLAISLKLGTRTGTNTIIMVPVHDLNNQMLMIDTKPDVGILDEIIDPAQEEQPYKIPVGTENLIFSFTLLDKYGNPVAYEPVRINIPDEPEILTNTNANGQTPFYSYGAKGKAVILDITATVVSDTSITHSFTVAFVNVNPTVSLSVSPLNMGSFDYDNTFKAAVTVRVGDDLGNPISDPQDILLTLDSCTDWDQNWSTTILPYLGTGGYTFSGTTGSNGEMTTVFTPGALKSGSYWHESCVLTAEWISDETRTSQPVTLTWSNHPYLDVSITTSPQVVEVNEEIDVTVCISANGPSGGGPVTIVLDQDASQAMGAPTKTAPGSTRNTDAIIASTEFVTELKNPQVQMGMEHVGDQVIPVGNGHVPIKTLDDAHFADILMNISLLEPSQTSEKTEAPSIEASIQKIIAATAPGTGHEGDTKILLVFSDGGANINDQIPHFNEITNLNKIIVIGVCYNNNCEDGNGPVSLKKLVYGSYPGGAYFKADSLEGLKLEFDKALALIWELSSESSKMTIDFSSIETTPGNFVPGSEVFEYVPHGRAATREDTIEILDLDPIKNLAERTRISRPDDTLWYQNQAKEWPNLKFNIGKIPLGKIWCAEFNLTVKQPGCYNAFGKDSMIDMGVGSPPEPLPDSPICVGDTITPKILTGTLDVSLDDPIRDTDFVQLIWYPEYNSQTLTNKATMKLSYRISDTSPWKVIYTTEAGVGLSTQTTTFDVRKIRTDVPIYFRVDATANANDALPAFAEKSVAGFIIVGGERIKLR